MLTAAGDGRQLSQKANATGLSKDGLRMLHLALQSAPNIEVVSRFRWQSSMEKTKQKEAATIRPFQNWAAPSVMPREQEEIMFEEEEITD